MGKKTCTKKCFRSPIVKKKKKMGKNYVIVKKLGKKTHKSNDREMINSIIAHPLNLI